MNVRRIPLRDGGHALVSSEDYAWLSQHEWYELSGRAIRTIGDSIIGMHVAIVKPAEGMEVDHINRNPLDNRRENLRECTPAQNRRNRGPFKNNKTGYVGVRLSRSPGKFIAQIGHQKTTIYLGTYESAEEAARAYDAAAQHFHEEYATLNFPADVRPYVPRPYTPQQKSSIYRGVCWLKGHQKWTAQLRVKGKRVFRKYFDDELEAALAYDVAAREHLGADAHLNFPNGQAPLRRAA